MLASCHKSAILYNLSIMNVMNNSKQVLGKNFLEVDALQALISLVISMPLADCQGSQMSFGKSVRVRKIRKVLVLKIVIFSCRNIIYFYCVTSSTLSKLSLASKTQLSLELTCLKVMIMKTNSFGGC